MSNQDPTASATCPFCGYNLDETETIETCPNCNRAEDRLEETKETLVKLLEQRDKNQTAIENLTRESMGLTARLYPESVSGELRKELGLE